MVILCLDFASMSVANTQFFPCHKLTVTVLSFLVELTTYQTLILFCFRTFDFLVTLFISPLPMFEGLCTMFPRVLRVPCSPFSWRAIHCSEYTFSWSAADSGIPHPTLFIYVLSRVTSVFLYDNWFWKNTLCSPMLRA